MQTWYFEDGEDDTPEGSRARIRQLVRQCFESVKVPASWYMEACRLKSAAERLDWIKYPVRDEEGALSHASVYRMLMGMSIENLVKGIMVAEGREPLDGNDKLSGEFKNHFLSELAPLTRFTFTPDDMQLLRNLEGFVMWGGRYPGPTKVGGMFIRGASSEEYQAELDLWERLKNYLRERLTPRL